MTLKDLFNYIEQLNNIYKELGTQKEYSLKFAGTRSYEDFECFNNTYLHLNDFIKAMKQETYYTNLDNCNVKLVQSEFNLEDCEFETHFEGETNNTHEKVEQNCFIFIRSTYKDEIQ